MIVPSVDIAGGSAVQLVGGEKQVLDAGDPRALVEQFGVVGEIAVIDLDAARGEGDNRRLIEELLPLAPCRVGGGIRDVESARWWLDAGARKVILGTAATAEVLSQLPRDRVVAALDARNGEVVVDGWRTRTGISIEARMEELKDLVGGFLVTFVEREGRMEGTARGRAQELVRRAGPARVTVAGGVTTVQEVAWLDELGADAQVGMALYTGRLTLADAFMAPLRSERADGLWPTVVSDESGGVLGLAWSGRESLSEAVETRRGVYQSRRRGRWRKGETSGATQELLAVDVDCDRDTLRFTVRQRGAGFCHLDRYSCFGEASGLSRLTRTLEARRSEPVEGSYTSRLFGDPELLASKLREEAEELCSATGRSEVIHEAADLIYFTMVRALGAGVSLADVEAELDRRSLRITRRRGDAKDGPREGAV